MKLLLDQNLSYKLLTALQPSFPGSAHVRDHALDCEDDETVWHFAAQRSFAIITKDSDFQHRALLRGHPPKVIHLRVGNCRTEDIAACLCAHEADIRAFLGTDESLLVID